MNELFPTQESLSPKLKWMKEHGIATHYCANPYDDEWEPWSAFQGTWEQIEKEIVAMDDDGRFVTAMSEEEALWKLSQNLKIPFYKRIEAQ
jgi:hypothetical protein